MYGIRYVLGNDKILFFEEVVCDQFIRYTNNVRDACSFDSFDEALEQIRLLQHSYDDFLDGEVFKFELAKGE